MAFENNAAPTLNLNDSVNKSKGEITVNLLRQAVLDRFYKSLSFSSNKSTSNHKYML